MTSVHTRVCCLIEFIFIIANTTTNSRFLCCGYWHNMPRDCFVKNLYYTCILTFKLNTTTQKSLTLRHTFIDFPPYCTLLLLTHKKNNTKTNSLSAACSLFGHETHSPLFFAPHCQVQSAEFREFLLVSWFFFWIK